MAINGATHEAGYYWLMNRSDNSLEIAIATVTERPDGLGVTTWNLLSETPDEGWFTDELLEDFLILGLIEKPEPGEVQSVLSLDVPGHFWVRLIDDDPGYDIVVSTRVTYGTTKPQMLWNFAWTEESCTLEEVHQIADFISRLELPVQRPAAA